MHLYFKLLVFLVTEQIPLLYMPPHRIVPKTMPLLAVTSHLFSLLKIFFLII